MPKRSRRSDTRVQREDFESTLAGLADVATGIAKTAPSDWSVRKRFFASYHEASRAFRRGDLDGAARELGAAERTARHLVSWHEVWAEFRKMAERLDEEVGQIPLELHGFPAVCSLHDLRLRAERLLLEGRPYAAAGVMEVLRGSRARWSEPGKEERKARPGPLPSQLEGLPQSIAELVDPFPGLARRLEDELGLRTAGQRDLFRSRVERSEYVRREERWDVERRRIEASLSRWIERKERNG